MATPPPRRPPGAVSSIDSSLLSGIASGIFPSIREGNRMATGRDTKVRENRLRRMADRHRLRLMKSRARDPRDLTYGGYQLVDVEHGGVSFGWGNANRGYAADLDDIEDFLTSDGNTNMTEMESPNLCEFCMIHDREPAPATLTVYDANTGEDRYICDSCDREREAGHEAYLEQREVDAQQAVEELHRERDRRAAEPRVYVRRQYNDYRQAPVPASAVSGLHWAAMSGGVQAVANRDYLCGYIWCAMLPDGIDFGHSCNHGPPPHRIKVVITKAGNSLDVYAALKRQAQSGE